jgi:hypothetical protein
MERDRVRGRKKLRKGFRKEITIKEKEDAGSKDEYFDS